LAFFCFLGYFSSSPLDTLEGDFSLRQGEHRFGGELLVVIKDAWIEFLSLRSSSIYNKTVISTQKTMLKTDMTRHQAGPHTYHLHLLGVSAFHFSELCKNLQIKACVWEIAPLAYAENQPDRKYNCLNFDHILPYTQLVWRLSLPPRFVASPFQQRKIDHTQSLYYSLPDRRNCHLSE
jgi:hypothetical protein